MTIGERIRFIRKQRNMTIDALAKSVGVTRQTISRYETGAIIEIPRNKLEKIAEELGVKYEYKKIHRRQAFLQNPAYHRPSYNPAKRNN